MKNLFSRIKDKIANAIFPVYCFNCGKEGSWLCEDCMSFMEFFPVFLCPKCGKKSYLGRVCKRCLGKSFLDGIIAMDRYNNPLIQNLIKLLKFRYITDLEPILNRLVRKFCLKYSEIFPADAVLVPVPLHPLRFRQREFNQAEFIANFVSNALGYKILKILERIRYTYRQSELPKEMKENNIKGAFRCNGDLRGKNVILIDDIYTSGATMQECAKVLKEAGAKEVWGFVLAR